MLHVYLKFFKNQILGAVISFPFKYSNNPAGVVKLNINLYEYRAWYLKPVPLFSSLVPYFPSPSKGCPIKAKCALIWWVLPVNNSTSKRLNLPYSFKTLYLVFMCFNPSFLLDEIYTLFCFSFLSRYALSIPALFFNVPWTMHKYIFLSSSLRCFYLFDSLKLGQRNFLFLG